ncbi:fasciclin-like arabinogalactan protein 14 [Diospyros lotus]|uniref:fasciclin-like arabinogalactan protein 14 n=1 Tax=Diospyros lotus TaxID=55363 RepID=UPI002252429B|nr:fasciclin-like arabinogalactan protein 14 [Diospyros lotus]
MAFYNSFLVAFSGFLFFCSANAFNITKLLDKYPDFSTFNSYLTQTKLAGEINSRQTITILVVDNGAISSLSDKPEDVLRNILSLHVVLDYYDVQKLQKLPKKTAILTTLFQASGLASGQQGFLNATDVSPGSVAFGSAVNGSQLDVNLVKSVASHPYDISVLQVSGAIVPTGIEKTKNNNSSGHSTPPPKRSPSPAATPAPAPSKAAPAPKAPKMPASPPRPADAPAPSWSSADSKPVKSDSADRALRQLSVLKLIVLLTLSLVSII